MTEHLQEVFDVSPTRQASLSDLANQGGRRAGRERMDVAMRSPKGPWRFSTRDLLIAVGGTALVLTILRVMDGLNYDVIVWLAVWLPYQTVTLVLIVWFLRSRDVLEGGGGDGGGMRG